MTQGWREQLKTELGRPELFDEGIEAARNACVAGASIAAAAITAAAYYDSPLVGIGSLRACMSRLSGVPLELESWRAALQPGPADQCGDRPFTPGFGFLSAAQAETVQQACRRLSASGNAGPALHCAFFRQHHAELTALAGPLNPSGLAALVFVGAELDLESAEREFMCWKIETATAEAQKTRRAGVAAFPFLTEHYLYEGPLPPERTLDLGSLLEQAGIRSSDD
jgi:hypothetical protein